MEAYPDIQKCLIYCWTFCYCGHLALNDEKKSYESWIRLKEKKKSLFLSAFYFQAKQSRDTPEISALNSSFYC